MTVPPAVHAPNRRDSNVGIALAWRPRAKRSAWPCRATGYEHRRWRAGNSDEFDRDAACVCRQRFDVGLVSAQHGSTRLGQRDDESING